MKKKMATILAAGMVSAMLIGCGGGSEVEVSKTDESTYTVETSEAESTESSAAAETTESTVAESSAESTEAEEEVSDYLSENGLVVTPISSATTRPVDWIVDDESWGIEQVPCTYSITETVIPIQFLRWNIIGKPFLIRLQIKLLKELHLITMLVVGRQHSTVTLDTISRLQRVL